MDVLRAPIKVSVDVTRRCNISCLHCRCTSEVSPQRELSFDAIASLIDDLAAMRVFRFGVSGGEPLVRDDIVDVILHAAKRLPGRVFLSTNGTLLDSRLLDRLMSARDRLTVKISIDGPSRIHDALRGRAGLFEAARDAIALCRSRGFAVATTTTLMRGCLDYLDELLALLPDLGCRTCGVVEVVPVGAASRSATLSAPERVEAWMRLHAARARFAEAGSTLAVRIPFMEGDGFVLGCHGGLSHCGILADGSVVGCRLLPNVVAGNVRELPLSVIWSRQDSFASFRRGKAELPSACRECERADTCNGGCRAYARGLAGSEDEPDPRCSRNAGFQRDHSWAQTAASMLSSEAAMGTVKAPATQSPSRFRTCSVNGVQGSERWLKTRLGGQASDVRPVTLVDGRLTIAPKRLRSAAGIPLSPSR